MFACLAPGRSMRPFLIAFFGHPIRPSVIMRELQIRFPLVQGVSTGLLGGARRHEDETWGGAVVFKFVAAA